MLLRYRMSSRSHSSTLSHGNSSYFTIKASLFAARGLSADTFGRQGTHLRFSPVADILKKEFQIFRFFRTSAGLLPPTKNDDTTPISPQEERGEQKEHSMKKICTLGLIVTLLLGSGCAMQSNTGKGAAYGTAGGAAAGAILGQIIGGNTKSTLIGTAAGAVIGGLAGTGIGNMMDRQENDMRQALANSQAVAVQREGNALALTFKSDFTFDVNSTSIRPGLYTELDRVAQVLSAYPQTTILVAGHTDSSGSESYNQQLSERRAQSVKNALVQRGVDASRIQAIGYGESSPIADNNTESGRQQNRRVEVRINPMQQ